MAGLEKTTEALGDKCLGILGAGHMGRAVARGLAGAGFPLSRLRVCHRGSSATLSAIQADGLEQCLVRPDQLGLECGIIVAAIRPQDRGSIAALSPGSLFISFMAGTPLASLPLRPGIERVRVMPSAPSTIALRRGIAAVFPQDHVIAGEICRALGLTTIPVSSEDSLHAFTALGPCLPVALAVLRSRGKDADDTELEHLGARNGLSDYGRILSWARSVVPSFHTDDERESFIASAATRGGVTEAIITAIRNGRDLPDALEAGIRRSRELHGD